MKVRENLLRGCNKKETPTKGPSQLLETVGETSKNASI